MRTVFISHSWLDDAEKKFFAYILSSVELKPIFAELVDLTNKYAALEIRNKIVPILISRDASTALFVVLGKNLEFPPSPQHTHNWVNFEVGVAAGSNLQVWVLEQEGDSINFPVPYVTDYMTYVMNDGNDNRRMADVFKRRTTGSRLGLPPPITCSNCHACYNYWNDKSEITCPVCRVVVQVIRKARP
jgi:hypothetical protein